jgi:dUTP pyrophosphatase
MSNLRIYKTHSDVALPSFGTDQAACFDLAVCTSGKTEYKGFNSSNREFVRDFSDGSLTIMPGDRVLVPTGIIFDIPAGYSLRIHARSGLSLKQGLILANSEAVIDSDYVLETMVMLTNVSGNAHVIKNGDRVAQAELVPQLKYKIEQTPIKPSQKTNRTGGLGSTGVSAFSTENVQVQLNEQSEQTVKRGRGRPRKVA